MYMNTYTNIYISTLHASIFILFKRHFLFKISYMSVCLKTFLRLSYKDSHMTSTSVIFVV